MVCDPTVHRAGEAGRDAYKICIIIHMARTTLNLDDRLIEQARRVTGIVEKTALVHEGLQLLIQRAAARRLAALGGSDSRARAPRRRRSRAGR